ncbi:MAG: DUF4097 family beta strand repeat-containing protein [Faecalibacterium sp.]|jgi:DUF4097 and DUF4098 domain-containing protein YvlB|nr:DUF4097 family beta strand repeat-containing protein [Faecalibacterium sp.]
MDQQQYLDQLGQALNMLSPEEIADVQNYYANSIRGEVLNGISEEKAIEHLGPADQVADRVLRTRAQPMPSSVMGPRRQHGRKRGLVIAGVVIAACFAVASASEAANAAFSGNHAAMGRQSFTAAAADVQTISITAEADDVSFETSPDDDIHLEWTNSKPETHTAAQDGSTLTLETGTYHTADFSLSFSDDDTEVVVKLPEGYEAGTLTVQTSSGDIDADNIAVQDSLALTTTSGSISGYGLIVPGTLAVNTTSGDVSLWDASLGAANLKSTSGYLDLSESTVAGDATILSTSGDISWDEGALSGTGKFASTSGGIEISGVSTKGDLKADTTSGDVSFELKNKDYSITANSVSGDINIPKTNGTHAMALNTVSGGIDVSFTD